MVAEAVSTAVAGAPQLPPPCRGCPPPTLCLAEHRNLPPSRQRLLILPPASAWGPLNRTRHRVPLRIGVTLCPCR